jgi:phage terminase small subunit
MMDDEIDADDEAPQPKPKLEPRQQRFIDEYLIDLNGTQASLRAGYGTTSRSAAQNGHRMLRMPHIAEAIAEALAKGPGVTRTRIVDELARVAFANVSDYHTWGPNGIIGKSSDEIPEEQMAAIAEVYQETGKSPRVKLYDKMAALEKLARVLGMLKDRHEHTGPNGGPIQTDVIDRPERETREEWLERRRRELGAVPPLGSSTWPTD